MILLSDARLNSDEFDINARTYVENLKIVGKAQAKEIMDEIDNFLKTKDDDSCLKDLSICERNCEFYETCIYVFLEQLKQEIEG